MPSKHAGDVMVPLDEYPHIPYWFTLRQAIAEIEHAVVERDGRVSLARALLVFDEPYQLVGIVRRRDIFRGLEPRFLEPKSADADRHHRTLFDIKVDPNIVEISTGKLADTMRKRSERPISEVMQPISATVDIDDHLAKVIYLMVNEDQSLLPVLQNGKVVGVVRSVEVFKEVAHIVL